VLQRLSKVHSVTNVENGLEILPLQSITCQLMYFERVRRFEETRIQTTETWCNATETRISQSHLSRTIINATTVL